MELTATFDDEKLASSIADADYEDIIKLVLRVDEILCDGYFTNQLIYRLAGQLPGAKPGVDSH